MSVIPTDVDNLIQPKTIISRAISLLPDELKTHCQSAADHVHWRRQGQPKDCNRVATNGNVVIFIFTHEASEYVAKCCVWSLCPIAAPIMGYEWCLSSSGKAEDQMVCPWNWSMPYLREEVVIVDCGGGKWRKYEKQEFENQRCNKRIIPAGCWRDSFLLLSEILMKDEKLICTLERACFMYEQPTGIMQTKWSASMGNVSRFFDVSSACITNSVPKSGEEVSTTVAPPAPYTSSFCGSCGNKRNGSDSFCNTCGRNFAK